METNENDLLTRLGDLSDEQLDQVIAKATKIKDERAAKRKKEALEEIKKIAKEHGLDVSVAKPRAKRGRPKKSD